MAFSDLVQSVSAKIMPEKRGTLPLQPSAASGIAGGGHVPFDDDMIVSKPAIIFHASQVFFNFLAMCCFASVAAFQAKWKVGPSGLTGFAIFISVTGIFLSLFMLFVPVVYEKYDKGARLARALKEMRVSFILAGTGTTCSLLIAFITTISAWTEPGCKDASKDPHADKGKDFQNGLPGWCSTKKAGAVFFWFTFAFWVATLTLAILDWRSGKSLRPRDTPFTHPEDPEEFDDDDETGSVPTDARKSTYRVSSPTTYQTPYDNSNTAQSPFNDTKRYSGAPSVSSTNYSAAPSIPPPRQSMDVYGAFSDPPPSGFAPAPPAPSYAAPLSPPPTSPSRVMQYAAASVDPYDAVRNKVNAGRAQSPPSSNPPSYISYPNPYQ